MKLILQTLLLNIYLVEQLISSSKTSKWSISSNLSSEHWSIFFTKQNWTKILFRKYSKNMVHESDDLFCSLKMKRQNIRTLSLVSKICLLPSNKILITYCIFPGRLYIVRHSSYQLICEQLELKIWINLLILLF